MRVRSCSYTFNPNCGVDCGQYVASGFHMQVLRRVLSTRRSESSNISLVVSYRIAVDGNNQIATFLPPDRNMKHEVVFILVGSRENDPGLKLQRFWLFPGEHVPAEMSVRSRRLEDWIL